MPKASDLSIKQRKWSLIIKDSAAKGMTQKAVDKAWSDVKLICLRNDCRFILKHSTRSKLIIEHKSQAVGYHAVRKWADGLWPDKSTRQMVKVEPVDASDEMAICNPKALSSSTDSVEPKDGDTELIVAIGATSECEALNTDDVLMSATTDAVAAENQLASRSANEYVRWTPVEEIVPKMAQLMCYNSADVDVKSYSIE